MGYITSACLHGVCATVITGQTPAPYSECPRRCGYPLQEAASGTRLCEGEKAEHRKLRKDIGQCFTLLYRLNKTDAQVGPRRATKKDSAGRGTVGTNGDRRTVSSLKRK